MRVLFILFSALVLSGFLSALEFMWETYRIDKHLTADSSRLNDRYSLRDIKTVFSSDRNYLQMENIYRELNLAVNYNDQETFVVGHKNPDSDSVCSAVAYAAMYNKLGIKASPRVSSKINNETSFILKKFGVEVPPVLEDAAGKNIVMVDHTVYGQAVSGMDKANLVGIVDHHALGDVVSSSPLYIRSLPVGSTATVITIEYQERDLEIDPQIAGLLLGAVLSDTVNLTLGTTTAIDRIVVEKLKEISGVSDVNAFYEEIADAATSYGDMPAEEIFNTDYKEFPMGSRRVGITQVNMKDKTKEEITSKMAAVLPEMYKVKKVDMLYVLATDLENKKTEILYCGDGAFDALKQAFGSDDGKHVWLDKVASRKKDIVPKLMEIIK